MRFNGWTCLVVVGLVGVGGCSASEQPGSTSSPPANVEPSAVKADKFNIVHDLTGDTLTVSLDTDLPDFTDVMVSVSRSYFEKGNKEEYAIDYFQERSTVGAWRQPKKISVSHDSFSAKLQQRQKETAQAGIGGQLDRVADEVEVDFTVPINQTNKAFGDGNRNLSGGAVKTKGNWRLVESEVRVSFPVGAKAVAGPQWANATDLEVGRTYRPSRETPLMPELNPSDPTAAIEAIKRIPAGGSITIKRIGTKDGARWYQVEARDGGNRSIGTGWVNSDAFIGQQIQVVPKR